MESNEQNIPSANDGVFCSTTTSADMHWYQYWPSHPESSALYPPPMNSQVPGHWTCYVNHSQSVSHTNLPPAPNSLEVWDPLYHRRADHQYVGGGGGVCPYSQGPLGAALQIPDDRSSHHDEQSSTPWLPNYSPPAHTMTASRRPSHYSDPGLPTNFQDNSGSPLHSDLQVMTGSGATTTSKVDPQGTKQPKSPADAEPPTSAGPSPGGGHVVRPVIRCWDHGCDGRRFSSISNFRRHQRERAGQTPVCFCPRCGAAFYRRWTRDHHVERGSCLRVPR